MDTLNTTETRPDPKAAMRKHFDFTRLLVQRDRLPWFWFFFTVAVLLLLAIGHFLGTLPGSLRVCRLNIWGVHPIRFSASQSYNFRNRFNRTS